jgi:HPt (histidine-containing phosphotransfer) domain-containing protein
MSLNPHMKRRRIEVTDYDEADPLERTAGDRRILSEVVRFTLEDIPEILKGIQKALDEEKWQDVGRLAHKAKGTAGAAGARRLFQASLNLELAAVDEHERCAEIRSSMVEAFQSFRSHPEVRRISSLDAGGDASIG